MDLVEDEKNRDFLFFLMLMFYLTNYLKKKHEIVYIYRGSLGCPDRGLYALGNMSIWIFLSLTSREKN